MLPLQRLIFEVVVLGLMACAVGAVLRKVTPLTELQIYFALGAFLHLGFELLGLNDWYCRNRLLKL